MQLFSQLDELEAVSANLENQINLYGDPDGGLKTSLKTIDNIVENIKIEMADIEKTYAECDLVESFQA